MVHGNSRSGRGNMFSWPDDSRRGSYCVRSGPFLSSFGGRFLCGLFSGFGVSDTLKVMADFFGNINWDGA